MKIQIEQIAKSSGRIIINQGHTDVLELPTRELIGLIKTHGFLVLRGFRITQQQFESFARRFTARFVTDPDRAFAHTKGKYTQQVGDGQETILLHCENASSPFRPDIIWFCCQVPAAQDGETTYCDSVRLWQSLAPSTQSLFTQKKIKYTRTYSPGSWKRFFGAGMTLASLMQKLDAMPGIHYHVNEDESVFSEYICPATAHSKLGGDLSFANSIIYNALSPNSAYHLSFEDNTLIPNAVIQEITEKASQLQGEICWEPGDVAMLDNIRFMHGRRAFTDLNRNILVLQGLI